jgi:hypothetical protein
MGAATAMTITRRCAQQASPQGEVQAIAWRAGGYVIKSKPVMDLAMPVLRTEPDVAAACADREENHDPGGDITAVSTRQLRLEHRLPFASEGVLPESR